MVAAKEGSHSGRKSTPQTCSIIFRLRKRYPMILHPSLSVLVIHHLSTLTFSKFPGYTRPKLAASVALLTHTRSFTFALLLPLKYGKFLHSGSREPSQWSLMPYQVSGHLIVNACLGAEKVPPSYISARCSPSSTCDTRYRDDFEKRVAI